MNATEHRTEAERLLDLAAQAYRDEDDDAGAACERRAQVHAILALAPAPPPPAQAPQTRFDLSKPSYFPTATGGVLTITPGRDKTGLVLNYEEDAWLMEDPADLRTLASLLTAHADRLESRS